MNPGARVILSASPSMSGLCFLFVSFVPSRFFPYTMEWPLQLQAVSYQLSNPSRKTSPQQNHFPTILYESLRLLFVPVWFFCPDLHLCLCPGNGTFCLAAPRWGEVSPMVWCELRRGQRSSSKWNLVLFAVGHEQEADGNTISLPYRVGELISSELALLTEGWSMTPILWEPLREIWRKTTNHRLCKCSRTVLSDPWPLDYLTIRLSGHPWIHICIRYFPQN